MLVLCRRFLEKTIITTAGGERIVVQVINIHPGEVRLGFEAEPSVTINREEVEAPPATYGRSLVGRPVPKPRRIA